MSPSHPSPYPSRPGRPEPELTVVSPGPFPPIEVERPYLPYARMLMQDMASAQSEMTAIYQYMFQHWAVETVQPEFAAALRKIAQVEMRHLDTLGRLVVLLGGDPRCQASVNNRRSAWNGNMVNYNHQLLSMARSNLIGEQYARNTYLAQANMVRDPKLAAVLRKLAADEDIHAGIFQRFFTEFQQSKQP